MKRARVLMLGLLMLSTGNVLAHGHGGSGGRGHGGHSSSPRPAFGGHLSMHGAPLVGYYPSPIYAQPVLPFGYGFGYGPRPPTVGVYAGYVTAPLPMLPPGPTTVYGDGARCVLPEGQTGVVHAGQCTVVPAAAPCPPPSPPPATAPTPTPEAAPAPAPGFGALAPPTRNNAAIARENGRLVLYENGVRLGTVEIQGGLPESTETEELARAVSLTGLPAPTAP